MSNVPHEGSNRTRSLYLTVQSEKLIKTSLPSCLVIFVYFALDGHAAHKYQRCFLTGFDAEPMQFVVG